MQLHRCFITRALRACNLMNAMTTERYYDLKDITLFASGVASLIVSLGPNKFLARNFQLTKYSSEVYFRASAYGIIIFDRCFWYDLPHSQLNENGTFQVCRLAKT